MVRLLAFALNVPGDERDGALEFAKGLWDPDEPELWQKDLTGRIVHWIEVGQPEERRLFKASARAERVSVYAFSHVAPSWWAAWRPRRTRRQCRRMARLRPSRAGPSPRWRDAAWSCRSTGRTESSGWPTASDRSRSTRAASPRSAHERRRGAMPTRSSSSGSGRQAARNTAARARNGSPRAPCSMRRSARASAPDRARPARRARGLGAAAPSAPGTGAPPRPVHAQRVSRTPRAFAGDARALAAASRMVGCARTSARAVHARLRLPAVRACRRPRDAGRGDPAVDAPGGGRPERQSMLDYAWRHRAVIERFGRFPHRNDILGRRSTAEEIAFLKHAGLGILTSAMRRVTDDADCRDGGRTRSERRRGHGRGRCGTRRRCHGRGRSGWGCRRGRDRARGGSGVAIAIAAFPAAAGQDPAVAPAEPRSGCCSSTPAVRSTQWPATQK